MEYRVRIERIEKPKSLEKVHFKIEITLLGNSGVGKTNLIHKLLDRNTKIDPTSGVEDFSVIVPLDIPYAEPKEIPQAQLLIHDTSGDPRFQTFLGISLSSPVMIIMYDCQRRETYGIDGSVIMDYVAKIRQKNGWAHNMIVLMAGKADRDADVQIPHEEALKFAKKHGWIFMKYTKRMHHDDVKKKFSNIAKAALERWWMKAKGELWEDFIEPPCVLYDIISD